MNCDTCEYKFPGEVPGEGEWICNNGESERYAETVRPEERCPKYKKAWRAEFMRRLTRIN